MHGKTAIRDFYNSFYGSGSSFRVNLELVAWIFVVVLLAIVLFLAIKRWRRVTRKWKRAGGTLSRTPDTDSGRHFERRRRSRSRR